MNCQQICRFAFLAVLSFYLFSCEKEVGSPQQEQYTIDLSIQRTGREISLTWNQTNDPAFERYSIVRSSSSINNAEEPENPFHVIMEASENSFLDGSYPKTGEVFYQLHVVVGERHLVSQTVSVDFKNEILDIQAFRVEHDSENERLYIFDDLEYKIHLFDLTQNTILNSLEVESGDYKMAVGNAGMGSELFISKVGSGMLEIYDASSFEFHGEMNAIGNIQDIEVGEEVFILAANQSGETLTVYRRSDFSRLSGSNVADHYDRKIKLIPNVPRSLIDKSREQLIRYNFNEDWSLLSEESLTYYSDPLREIVFSPMGNFFIADTEGYIYDLSLNQTSGELGFSTDFAFSADFGTLYAFLYNSEIMVEFSSPDLERLEIIRLGHKPLRAFRINEEEVLVVGLVDEFTPHKTYIDILKI